jgi:hypothetical protein
VRRLLLLVPLAVLLVAAPPAHAGGFATVGLSSGPEGTDAGQPWNVDLTVLAHGRTPVDGIAPVVTIRNGTTVRSFTAKPAGEPGVYSARVVFPSGGTWRYEVKDGYVDEVHAFPPVEIAGDGAAPAAAGTDGGGIAAGWLLGAGAALLLALGVLAVDRRRRHGGAPQPA